MPGAKSTPTRFSPSSPASAATRISIAGAAITALLLSLACGSPDGSPTFVPTSSVPTATLQAISESSWTSRAPLPNPRSEIASAVLDGKVYVMGGFNSQGGITTTVEVYDAATDRWERKAPLPEPRDHAMAASFGGKVYVFGGHSAADLRTVVAYEPSTDRWTPVADMPFRRVAGGAAVLDDRILVAGGSGDSPRTSMIYDPAGDRWSTGPQLFEPREHLGMAAVGDSVYVVGGRWDDVLKDGLEELNAPAGPFRMLAPMPTARGGTSAGALNGMLIVAGGEAFGPSRTFKEVEVYDPATDSWSRAPDLPTPRHGLAVQGVENALHVIGGGPTAGLSVAPENEALRLR